MLTQFSAADGDLSQPSPHVISATPGHGTVSPFVSNDGWLWSVLMLLSSESTADDTAHVIKAAACALLDERRLLMRSYRIA